MIRVLFKCFCWDIACLAVTSWPDDVLEVMWARLWREVRGKLVQVHDVFSCTFVLFLLFVRDCFQMMSFYFSCFMRRGVSLHAGWHRGDSVHLWFWADLPLFSDKRWNVFQSGLFRIRWCFFCQLGWLMTNEISDRNSVFHRLDWPACIFWGEFFVVWLMKGFLIDRPVLRRGWLEFSLFGWLTDWLT